MHWGGESTDKSSFKSTFSHCVGFPQSQRRYNFHQKRVSQKKVWLSSFSDQIHSGLESKIDDETKDWSTPLIITIWLSSINTAVTYWRLNTFSFTVNLNSHTNMKNVSCVISTPTCRVKLFSSLNVCESVYYSQTQILTLKPESEDLWCWTRIIVFIETLEMKNERVYFTFIEATFQIITFILLTALCNLMQTFPKIRPFIIYPWTE